jgi:ribonuclease-3
MVTRKKATENDIYIEKVSKLLDTLWLEFKDISLYILAFIHRSVVNEKPDFAPEHNERLEFLWDAVLELTITDHLYRNFPEKTEGELTDIRSALVRWRNLANISKKLWFSNHLILWKWEELWWWKDNDYLLANVVESVIWAIYLDLWIEESRKFIEKHIYSTLDQILENNLTKDFKTVVQEYAQAKFDITPHYKVLQESWPDHNKDFTVWIYLKEKKIGEWSGSSKKKGQESAAEQGYKNIKK